MTVDLETDKPAEKLEVPAAVLPLTPDEIDEMIADYETLVTFAKTAKTGVDDAKTRIIFYVDLFGVVPPHAEQSKRLTGRHNLATVTRGTTITVNEPAVTDFENFLDSKKLLDIFPRFFAQNTKHTLVKGAREVFKTLKLSRRIEEKALSLFGRAFDIETNSPSLKVETIKPEKPARTRKTGKAVA